MHKASTSRPQLSGYFGRCIICYLEIDENAKRLAERSGLQPCLFTPVAAVDEEAIEKYIVNITAVVSHGTLNKALVVEINNLPEINHRLPIWQLEESRILHHPKQLWVHINYTGFRGAYRRVFPDEDITPLAIDHVMNREIAPLRGFNYVRLIHISHGANSSSGGHVEKMGIKTERARIEARKTNPNYQPPKLSVQYADLDDIVKMINIKTGDSVLDPVNEAQWLVDEP